MKRRLEADFQRMLQLAEIGAKWHNDRRQVAFRIFISYMTLLVLALYQVIKLLGENSVNIPKLIILGVIGGFIFTHWRYCRWQGTIRIALINDIRRRDFYLKKAERIAYRLLQMSDSIYKDNISDEPLSINLGSGDQKEITEFDLFKQREPDIIPGNRIKEKSPSGKYPACPWWQDKHFLTQTVGPTFLLILLALLVFALFFKELGWFS